MWLSCCDSSSSLDMDVQTGQNGEGLRQEIAVVHQLRLGHVGETDKHLLVLWTSPQETEMNRIPPLHRLVVVSEQFYSNVT